MCMCVHVCVCVCVHVCMCVVCVLCVHVCMCVLCECVCVCAGCSHTITAEPVIKQREPREQGHAIAIQFCHTCIYCLM